MNNDDSKTIYEQWAQKYPDRKLHNHQWKAGPIRKQPKRQLDYCNIRDCRADRFIIEGSTYIIDIPDPLG